MTKAIVESASINNGLIVHFNVVDATGHVGKFRYIEPDESKYKSYEPGTEYTIDLTLFVPEALVPVAETPQPVEVAPVDPTPAPVEEHSIIDTIKDFFTPTTAPTADVLPAVSDTVTTPVQMEIAPATTNTPGLDAPTFEQKAAEAFPSTDSPAPTV